MKTFYNEYHDDLELVHLGAQLPWKHNVSLIEKVKDKSIRKWYMERCIEEGWSKSILIYQIDTNLFKRQKKNIKHNIFNLTLKQNSDLVSNTMKDPYIFEFIELKMDEFIPEYGSKIAFYLQALDEQIKDETDNPSIGIILCPIKNNIIVDYTLKYINKPIGVSEYKILDKLPNDYMKK